MTLRSKLAVFGSVALVLLSVYPGVLVDLLVMGALLWPFGIPALILGALVVQSLRARPAKVAPPDAELRADDEFARPRGDARRRRWISFAPALVALCFALVLTGTPRRVAFLLSRPAFRRHVARAPADDYEGERLGRLLGLYHVDRYAADPRGGVYFRTHAGLDGIGPDTMSYGFAYRPNPKGSPFGNARYRRTPLAGDWYSFSASDDY